MQIRDSIWIRDAKAENDERRYKMSIWLREAEVEADKAEVYWSEYFKAKEEIENGNIDPQSAIEALSDEDAEIIAKALMSGESLDMSQFKYWRQRSIEEEIKQREF